MPIEVRFKPVLGVGFLLASAFILFSGVVTGKIMLLGLGALNFLVSLGYLTRPMLVVHRHQVELKNLLGMTMKTLDAPLVELEVRDGALFHGQKKIAGGMLARAADMDRIAAAVIDARGVGPHTRDIAERDV